MSEKYTIIEMKEKSNLLEWLVINGVTKLGDFDDNFKELPKDGKWELKLTIEGVELPVLQSFKDLEKQMDEMIERKAKELLGNKLFEIEDIFTETIDDLREKLQLKRQY